MEPKEPLEIYNCITAPVNTCWHFLCLMYNGNQHKLKKKKTARVRGNKRAGDRAYEEHLWNRESMCQANSLDLVTFGYPRSDPNCF